LQPCSRVFATTFFTTVLSPSTEEATGREAQKERGRRAGEDESPSEEGGKQEPRKRKGERIETLRENGGRMSGIKRV
jgi:hypothetical protein